MDRERVLCAMGDGRVECGLSLDNGIKSLVYFLLKVWREGPTALVWKVFLVNYMAAHANVFTTCNREYCPRWHVWHPKPDILFGVKLGLFSRLIGIAKSYICTCIKARIASRNVYASNVFTLDLETTPKCARCNFAVRNMSHAMNISS